MRVVIIGAVAAGMSAAAKLKRSKPEYDVIVYEKTDVVSFGACGLPYFVGGFFDDPNNMIARAPEKFRESGIDLNIFNEVISVDTENKKLKVKNVNTGETFIDSYDKLMIATGASSIIPPIKNVKLENVSTLKSLDDGVKVKELMNKDEIKKIAIIGAGFIGLEAVEAAKKLGKEVVVFQLEDRILPQVFDKEITDILESEIRKHEVDLRLEEIVSELVGETKVEKVVTNKGEYEADLVIIATGVRPNTAFLKDTGMDMLPNGAIIIDEFGRTSIEDIYAAGDCATIQNIVTGQDSYVPLATGANKLGRIVGENLAGANNSFQGSLGSSCIKIMDMEAAATGLTETQASKLGVEVKAKFISDFNQTNYYPGRDKMYVKLVYDASTKVILGGQVAGFKDAVQRCNVIAACIFGKLTTNQLGMLDLCYAPPFARTWDILNVAGNVSK
ncbi:coenzyme A disulfide reductase [[Clostridium] sordellii]|uniref:Coenzyme A disulfide reductase n=1 Tax=Paraclostridium sordellii TaxID=1505 RepID=A0ABM9RKP1_PARSO|nr:CoA-disulfide reductase [Paeniclostridium sordellii]CEJ72571.1 Coenzyme A disulfide reductase [[Clostridium] sordellii] [Paeniclostridium sordellii]CEN68124.1 coenzyme A disulfide reductase [[Clostridium] sordellii] [Paeniclostridium sordellii]CEN71391.1 coenzyme A disulfide reductase [[Clostridium] sordellii] [Paeniclostridium sordellii]CEO21244.1 coenzyme A disulfide reductase [[Clostridium] sordellii] [Paeniclostridium sordellii]CEP77016.1 coenzyme A disulfide reductase [[Clostridium] so